MAQKRIHITKHARFEMRRRHIPVAAVIALVRQPEQVVPSRKGRRIHQSRIGPAGRLLLRVVVKEDARDYHVVTVYKTNKVAKYWRTP